MQFVMGSQNEIVRKLHVTGPQLEEEARGVTLLKFLNSATFLFWAFLEPVYSCLKNH